MKRNTAYKYEFTVEVCGNSQTNADNCVTTTTNRIVEVYSCQSNITFLLWSPSVSNPIQIGAAGVTDPLQLQSAGTNYVSISNTGLCSLQSYAFSGTTDASKFTFDTSTGQIDISTGVAYTDQFTVTVCAGNTDPLNCKTSVSHSVQVTAAAVTPTPVTTTICTTTNRLTTPEQAETTISSDYINNETYPMVNMLTYVNSINQYEVDSSLFFVTNCSLTQYEIVKVWDTLQAKELTASEYSTYITLDGTSGLL